MPERKVGGASSAGDPPPLPFLKWAGGKRWLVDRYPHLFPTDMKRYVEPFLGGGSVFFAIGPRQSVLADLNTDLVNLYVQMRDCPGKLLRRMKKYQISHDKEFYYKERARSYQDPVLKAAKLLYLNRTCFNGLYRVNLDGIFNVPIGTKDSILFPTDDFEKTSLWLGNSILECQDFEKTVDEAQKGDFIFADPPYTVRHNFNNFIKYNEKLFSWDDQIRLKDSLDRARKRGAKVMLCNADHSSVRELYGGEWHLEQVRRASVLAANPEKRVSTTELVIRSYSLMSSDARRRAATDRSLDRRASITP